MQMEEMVPEGRGVWCPQKPSYRSKKEDTPPHTPSMHASPLQAGSEVSLHLLILRREYEVSREKVEVKDG